MPPTCGPSFPKSSRTRTCRGIFCSGSLKRSAWLGTPSRSQQAMDRARASLLQNYRQQPVVLKRGRGTRVGDLDGKSYLDMLGGIATCALGHCHPQVVAALKEQADMLWHTSNVFYNLPQIGLAEKLTAASGLDRAFFCNSGAEANEALIKLVRR